MLGMNFVATNAPKTIVRTTFSSGVNSAKEYKSHKKYNFVCIGDSKHGDTNVHI